MFKAAGILSEDRDNMLPVVVNWITSVLALGVWI